jgi:hypothetical protein
MVGPWLQIFVNSSPKLSEVRETSGSHPNNEMLVFHVQPLYLLPSLSIGRVLDIFELILDVTLPSDVALINVYLGEIGAAFRGKGESISVIENTLGDKTTGDCRSTDIVERLRDIDESSSSSLVHIHNRVTVSERSGLSIYTFQLIVVSGLYISSVVLIEVV